MAFNPVMETRRKPAARPVSEDRASSLFSDSQASWVVFNPSGILVHDILSFSTENPLSTTEDEGETLLEREAMIKIALEHKTLFQGSRKLPLQEPEDDELIEGLDITLLNRINAWQKSTDASDVSDNVASWDLDADLIGQVLDTSILRRVPAFYGDTYFHKMSPVEFSRFKRSSAILKQSLTRKGFNTSDPNLISRLLSLVKWQDLLRTSGSLVDDYIVSTLSRAHLQEKKPIFRSVELSETTNSLSFVLCGGNNTSRSWNDV